MKDLPQTCGKVFLIGAGPGDPDLLTFKALRLIAAAPMSWCTTGSCRPRSWRWCPASTRRIDVGKIRGFHPLPQERDQRASRRSGAQGLAVARLKGGDPLIFGRGSEEADGAAGRGHRGRLVPGITAAQGAAASTGVPLTHRGLATGVRYVTGHRAKDAPLDLDWACACQPEHHARRLHGRGQHRRDRAPVDGPWSAADAAGAGRSPPPRRRARGGYVSALDVIAADVARADRAPVLFIIGHVVSLYGDRTMDELAQDIPADAYA